MVRVTKPLKADLVNAVEGEPWRGQLAAEVRRCKGVLDPAQDRVQVDVDLLSGGSRFNLLQIGKVQASVAFPSTLAAICA